MARHPEKPDTVAAEAERAQQVRAKACPRGCKRMPGLDCRGCVDRARKRVPEIH